jgi:integrating conjugative element protein (TIGR03759 family)
MPLLNRFPVSSLAILSAMLIWPALGHSLTVTQPQTLPLSLTTPQTLNPAVSELQIQRFDRHQWQLSKPEWQRYLSLMQGIRGSISPSSLSPIEVLGIHAETDAERKRYARRWAQLMREDVERILAFQQAYSEASLDLYGPQPVINKSPLPQTGTTEAYRLSNSLLLQDGDRLLVFLKVNGCPPCLITVQQVLALTVQQKVHVDIYFTDTQDPHDNPKIMAWAKQQGLDPKRLAQKTVTLNHDQGTLAKVSPSGAEVPVVFLMRHERLQPLAL